MSPVDELSLPQVQADLHAALNQWHDDDAATPLTRYHLFRLLQPQNGGRTREVSNQILLQALQVLDQQHPADAELLRLRFLDRAKVQTITARRNVSERKLYADQRRALARLAEIVADQERQTRQAQQRTLEQRLESPTYSQLVGVDDHLATLLTQLMTPGPPWLIALHGLGGIGKTTLADALVRQAIQLNRWAAVGWVSARPETFNLGGQIRPVAQPLRTAYSLLQALAAQVLEQREAATALTDAATLTLLERHLRERPHLVVIDNLETVEDAQSLAPLVRRLTNPTKFLLTTRTSLEAEQDIFHFLVPELSETSALRLLRQEATLRNLPHLLTCTDQELQPIVALVGGNPLALRLVAGQTRLHALGTILDDLTTAHTDAVDQFYTFVYQRAWENLDELSRQVLLILPLTPPQRRRPCLVGRF